MNDAKRTLKNALTTAWREFCAATVPERAQGAGQGILEESAHIDLHTGRACASVCHGRAPGPAPDRRSGMAKRKPEHTCEVCRTLGDIVRALDPEKYQCGAELEVAEAIQIALEKHLKRVGKRKERTGE